ncbi:uncharacterized protein I303_105634 [Kwoniella dejecticola CBS 10117]|uniref:Uncharacterized protein n=1 Tax=Kwoniella dejecticola CBS 10117 TaxID=1296121 RepID=A0A1A6A1X7_9TREE|nr:uncharacterized protein I303_04922 [Kwoniella dejecticola CBS 10117]OBR84066.1 hypothetical protein I303_04922 [Kwoniella dejecticola CBS 10117]
MQLQNASAVGLGYAARIAENVTWVYPFLPGEPPNVIHRNFAACVPSNVTIASSCCAAVNGTFITQQLTNARSLNQSEINAIFEEKYPGQNLTGLAYTQATIGDLTNTTNATTAPNSFERYEFINWCSFAYNPMSNDALVGTGYRSGPSTGNKPEAMNAWIQCFHDNVPQEAIDNAQAAYACATADVRDGGILEGFNRYTGPNPGSGADATKIVGSFWGMLGLVVIVSGMIN